MSPYHKNLNLKRSPWIRIVSKDIAVQSSEKSEWDGGGNRWGVVGKMGRESSRTSEGRPDSSERNRGRVANCSFATTFFKSIPISLRNVARRRRNCRMEKREMEMDREHAYITLSLSLSLSSSIYLSLSPSSRNDTVSGLNEPAVSGSSWIIAFIKWDYVVV